MKTTTETDKGERSSTPLITPQTSVENQQDIETDPDTPPRRIEPNQLQDLIVQIDSDQAVADAVLNQTFIELDERSGQVPIVPPLSNEASSSNPPVVESRSNDDRNLEFISEQRLERIQTLQRQLDREQAQKRNIEIALDQALKARQQAQERYEKVSDENAELERLHRESHGPAQRVNANNQHECDSEIQIPCANSTRFSLGAQNTNQQSDVRENPWLNDMDRNLLRVNQQNYDQNKMNKNIQFALS